LPDRHVRRALRVTTGFRLRWLSERGCLDRVCCDHRWMLKKVPDRGGEWVGWRCRVLASATGRRTLPASGGAPGNATLFFLWEAHPAPMNSARIGPGARAYRTFRKTSPCPHRARAASETRPAPVLTAQNWNPLQHPPTDRYQHNRGDPAPTKIEAGIPSSPASRETAPHGQEDLETKPDATHLTPVRSDPHLEQLPPVKRIFGYFFLQPKK